VAGPLAVIMLHRDRPARDGGNGGDFLYLPEVLLLVILV
jgi:hypothetical protein